MMPVSKALRDGAGVKPGDTVSVVMEHDEGERIVEAPPLLKKELAKSKTAQANWEKLSFTNKKEIALSISSAKQEETRQRRLAKAYGYPEDWQEMDGLGFQASDHFRDVALLKKADPGNAGSARVKADTSVLDRNTTEGEHGDLLSTNFTQSIQSGRTCLRGILLLKNGGEHDEVGPFGGGPSNLGRGMTRNTDQCVSTLSARKPDFLHVRW